MSNDQLARARQVDVLDYVLRHEADAVKRVGNSYRWKNHPSFEIKRGRWRWHSRGLTGRTALDYLTDVRGYGLVDAVCLLLGEKAMEHSGVPFSHLTDTPKSQPVRSTFVPPLRNVNNNRIIAYLQSRGVDKDVILGCIERGHLYESTPYHNCVFVGKDEQNKTRYVSLRGITSDFKLDADGSDKRYGFVVPPINFNNHEVAVFESPIDCLSHQTLCNHGIIPPFDGWRLSLGGTCVAALEHFLQNHPETSHCYVCTDNDKAGEKAAATIEEMLKITSKRVPPINGKKDWNDVLQDLMKTERTQNKAQTRATNERS